MTDPIPAPTPHRPVEYTQRRFANETRFRFDADSVRFTVKDKEGSSTITTQYAQVGSDRDFLVERNTWLQNVGWLWIAIGAFATAAAWYQGGRVAPSFWLLIGAACVAVARWRTTRYVKVPSEAGTLLVIEDGQKDTILGEIQARRTDQLRRWYDFFDDESPQRQQARFEWLHREGALDDDELQQRLARLRGMTLLPRPADEELGFSADAAAARPLN